MLLFLLACAHPPPPAADEPGLEARAAFLASPAPEHRQRPPNIVLMLADDLGKYDVSTYGGTRIQTVNIDALGAGGVVFDNGTITSPICAPSRAGLLTGRYQQRFGFELITHDRYANNWLERTYARLFAEGDGWELADTKNPPSSDEILMQGLPPGEITLAEILGHAGYATAIIGKWHLGTAPDRVPNARGFDYQYGFYEAHTLYAEPDRPEIVNFPLDSFADDHQWRMGRHGNCAIRRDGDEVTDEMYLTDRLVLESQTFIRDHRDTPFFLYLPFLAPHTPYQVPAAVLAQHEDEPDPGKRVYAAMLQTLDDAVGQVLDTLDEQGLADNTIVVLLSDNGGAAYTHVMDNAPLSGGKLTHLEGGVEVPFILRWPGVVAAGQRYGGLVSSLDLVPTLAQAAGAPLPEDRRYDGVSLLPFLSGGDTSSPHDALFWRAGGSQAVRVGRYKLMFDELTGQQALYDLSADVGETTDLAAEKPEQVEAMKAQLSAWEAGLMAPSWPPVMQYRTEANGREWIFPL